MSKQKPDNKNQDQAALELEAQKRDLMNADSQVKQMKDRLDRMEAERGKFHQENVDLKKKVENEKESLIDLIEFHKKEKEELREEKQRIEFDYNILKRKMDDIDEHYAKLLELKGKDFDMERQSLIDKIKQLEARLEKIDSFLGKQAELENERRQLAEALEKEKKDKVRELADKDREKVQATDMLKKDMLHKIQDTKQSLLALKKEQLETTTRLTVLQNHQLTTELEYQSKQTEKLLFKNSKLSEQVTSLKRDIEIHKQVEQELAKRSHFSQKLIKKLSARVKELEDLQENQQQIMTESQQKIDDVGVEVKLREAESLSATLQRKIAKMQNDNDILRNENNHLMTKLEQSKLEENKFNNLAVLLASNLENLKQSEDVKILDLVELRERPVEEWNTVSKQAILQILLVQAQQFLTKRYLNISDDKVNITLIDNANKSINFPKINQANEEETQLMQQSKRLQGVPLEISAQIVKSNLRDWGKSAQSQPNSQLSRKIKLK